MSWLQDAGEVPTLTAKAKARALPFALIARDIYPDRAGAQLLGALRIRSWAEVLADPQARRGLTRIDQLEVALGGRFGFNAAIYALSGSRDAATVVAFEGRGLSFASADKAERTLETWLMANASATFDLVNKLGEPIVDGVLKTVLGRGVFSDLLNARGAPSTAYDLADLLAREARRQYGDTTILTGHSLGGGLAQYGALRNGLRAIGFNSAGAGATRAGSEADETIVRIDTSGNFTNDLVTRYSDALTRHFGARYVVGKGSHDIDDVIRALQTPPPA